MANLLYAEYNKGCSAYWYAEASSPADYHYGESAVLACYYADLEPNTTYTIQRIDTSTRFRVALSSQDLKYLSASSDTSVSSPFSWGYKADSSSNPITFTTTSTATHLVVYYTNNSEYTTRVMLNEGSSIEPYEAPTRYFKSWRLINGELVYDGMPESLDYLTPPYPASFWRLDSDDILKVDITIRPRNWFDMGHNHRVKAYVKTMFVTVMEDPLEIDYADIPIK